MTSELSFEVRGRPKGAMNETNRLRLAVPVDERDHALGPADASVTVVTYGDYQCPDCHRRHREVGSPGTELEFAL